METEHNFVHPHNFVPVEVVKKKECHFCKHRLHHKVAFRCTACEVWCHNYCRNLVPYNCGVRDFMDKIVEVCKIFGTHVCARVWTVSS